VLLDHINPAPDDPTRPDTLTVWESREQLAAETGFSEVTIKDHLKRLRGEKDLRKGQRVTVLTYAEAPQSHRPARYEFLPAALDALVDPTRLEAFEARTPRGTHPYHRWRQWRASQMTPSETEGRSSFPQVPGDESSGERTLPQAETEGARSLPQWGQGACPELTPGDLLQQQLTTPPVINIDGLGKAHRPALEWRTSDGIYGEHRRCGTYHRCDQPCPPVYRCVDGKRVVDESRVRTP